MQEVLSVIEKVAPDTLQVLRIRQGILDSVRQNGPIGRRMLAEKIGMTERVLRTEVKILREQHLIETTKAGMKITQAGEEIFDQLTALLSHMQGNKEKERQLADYLSIDNCWIVPGNSKDDNQTCLELGKAVNELLNRLLPLKENIIAVMGGTTMLNVASQLTPQLGLNRELLFVPARGGLGERFDIQANAISSAMAENTGGKNRVLYAPEHVSPETYPLLLKEPEIKATLEYVKKANCVLFSIGEALQMAKRRAMDSEQFALLKNKKAVGEAFGEFVNKEGEIVYKIPRIGLQSKDLEAIPYVIAVAGGQHKAEAIEAYIKTAPRHLWLVTDEGAANQILKGVTL
ncbi:sugar-binding transcriptional regulator [Lacticigenium naphthae]|uniref:sugar-binding transcriptional regulator n=1 Tax=Lacticigenium naphthae TaxID=515351 RepID=UPI00041160BC|nr:sugar-binding domain-containing protein [Lacticigenium naphthae]